MKTSEFLKEFQKRACPIPARSKASNFCLSVDMKGASTSFTVELEDFFEANHDTAEIRIRGQIYYIEILKGLSMIALFKLISDTPSAQDVAEPYHGALR